ncbi:MAG: lactate utilization protein [Deltaproteobacteria bacterium]|nr:lactate utilization protein [Deltaproteobacteria bacterium]
MDVRTQEFAAAANRELKNERSRNFLGRLAPYFARSCAGAMKTFPDPAAAVACGRAIRADAVARLPDLLEQFAKNALACGAKIIWAKTAAQANEFILALAKEKGVRYVAKGKSMVTEEMGLNEYLKTNGIDAFETDLGEFIIQLLRRPPFHIVGPAINLPVEEIRDLFLAHGVIDEPTTDRIALGGAARRYLRDKFRRLDMAVTGVNMAAADTGAIFNVENEGNIRLCKSSPAIQVSVMSLEKVVPTMNDALHLLRLLCRHCTGQKLSSYVSIDCGPKKPGDADGPEELYILILDNGRSEIYRDVKAREALRCIRCGACLSVCPVYGKIGGYPYGWVYSGPMGQVLNPLLLGREQTRDLYFATTLCGACRDVCPAGVDHPRLFLHYREQQASSVRAQGLFFKAWGRLVKSGGRWHFAVRLLRPLINRFAANGVIRKMPGLMNGWFASRNLPALAHKTFHKQWKKQERQRDAGRR